MAYRPLALIAMLAWPSLASASVHVFNVGVDRGVYPTIAAAVAAAHAGDELDVGAGTYLNDYATITKPLTIVGVGGIPILQSTQLIPNGKAILVIDANVTIRNLEFLGAKVTDGNGAGIRYEAGNLTVYNSIFQSNQDGILTAPIPGGKLKVDTSKFINNGAGDGRTHAIYAGQIASLTVSNDSFSGTLVGHDVKSRALSTTVTGSTLDDGVTGTTSYAIDIPNGGVAVIKNDKITQGANTQNPSMLSFGAEGGIYAGSSLTVESTVFNNSIRNGIGVDNHTTAVAQLINDTFNGFSNGVPLRGPGEFINTPTAALFARSADLLPAVADPVPEAAPLALMAAGLLGLAAFRRRRAA